MSKKMRVIIDAGHGGRDAGAVKGSRYEKTDALRLAIRVGRVLRANGLDVAYTRTADATQSVTQKSNKANALGGDFFISIHRNASVSKFAKGAEVLVYSTSGKKLEVAQKIQRYFVKHGLSDRGIKVRKNLCVLRRTSMPAILVEVGFISNDYDNMIFDSKFNIMADCIAKGFMDVYGLKFKSLKRIQSERKQK